MPTMRSAGLSMKKTVNNLASTVHFGLDMTSKSLAHYVDLSQKISAKNPVLHRVFIALGSAAQCNLASISLIASSINLLPDAAVICFAKTSVATAMATVIA